MRNNPLGYTNYEESYVLGLIWNDLVISIKDAVNRWTWKNKLFITLFTFGF